MTVPTTFRADLHCHSTHSDGSCTPQELVQLAQQSGLNALSITDHDSISAFEVARQHLPKDFQLLPGVELSTTLGTMQIHVLGYAFQPQSAVLKQFCVECRQQRCERNRQILERLQARGIQIVEDEIMTIGDHATAYGRPHIAAAMMRRGYVKSIAEAFKRYLGEHASCYVPGRRYSVQESITVIHEAHGKAIIAHPHLIPGIAIVEQLLQFDFDGLEAYYSQFPAHLNAKWAKIADEKGWLATGGSDFHGSIRPNVVLGSATTPESVFRVLWNHFIQRRI
jgi:predicted metal-dependent phosphoesterase TrpH